ncbi:hypothetical protein SERLA73DRAFT_124775 [Serpula lacrymans var. lacrymans S7.3]|uniref:Uncharacterized protein n=1 Tax=Serpula lacrymans var. lacrymans (strain S7.3) TaxID=936435 RepID=F8Q4K9_SERL3|nr:hypothetical protein SERLA73DRAFT_124775 [Serpula lacrymans var. lacrymans S7.3]
MLTSVQETIVATLEEYRAMKRSVHTLSCMSPAHQQPNIYDKIHIRLSRTISRNT